MSDITNLTSTGTLSKFDYTYNGVGTVNTWQQQTDSNTPLLWTEGYDYADQLTSAVKTNTAITSPAVLSQSYGYDPAGNATSAGISGVTRTGTFNALNQLTSSTATGNQTVQFTGTVTGTSTVTVSGTLATLSGGWFTGGVPLVTGTTTTVPIVAADNQEKGTPGKGRKRGQVHLPIQNETRKCTCPLFWIRFCARA